MGSRSALYILILTLLALFKTGTAAITNQKVLSQLAEPSLSIAVEIENPLKIPGNSSAVHCDDPGNDLFEIDRLDISPWPLIGRVYFYELQIIGRFKRPPGPGIMGSLDIWNGNYHSNHVVDTFCNWVNVSQAGVNSCPEPKENVLTNMTAPFRILWWFVRPETVFTVRLDSWTVENKRTFCFNGTAGPFPPRTIQIGSPKCSDDNKDCQY